MDSGSQPVNTPDRQTNKLVDFIGTLIALLTLTLPLTVIAHYSNRIEPSPPTTYSLQQAGD